MHKIEWRYQLKSFNPFRNQRGGGPPSRMMLVASVQGL
jgi:hypothetical protein